MPQDNQNGWNEYSRLVLAELEKLNIRVGTRTDFINHFSINQSLCADGQTCPHLPNC